MGTSYSRAFPYSPKMTPPGNNFNLLTAGQDADGVLWSVAPSEYRKIAGVGEVPGLARASAMGNSIVLLHNPDVRHGGMGVLDMIDSGLYEAAIQMRVPRSALLLAIASGVIVVGVVTWRYVL